MNYRFGTACYYPECYIFGCLKFQGVIFTSYRGAA